MISSQQQAYMNPTLNVPTYDPELHIFSENERSNVRGSELTEKKKNTIDSLACHLRVSECFMKMA